MQESNEEITPDQKRKAFEVVRTMISMRDSRGKMPKQKDVGKALGMKEARISEAISNAWRAGIIDIIVTPPEGIPPDSTALAELEIQVTKKLQAISRPSIALDGSNSNHPKLEKVHIVPSAEGTVSNSSNYCSVDTDAFESTRARVCKKAAQIYYNIIRNEYNQIKDLDRQLHVGISWNRTCECILNLLKVSKVPYPKLVACPLVGMIGHTKFQMDSNVLANRLGARLVGTSIKLPFPAVSPLGVDPAKFRPVSRALEEISHCCVALSGVAPAHYQKGQSETSDLHERKMIDDIQLEAIKQQGGVAEICTQHFDKKGNHIPYKSLEFQVIGIQPDQMRRIKKFVIAVTPDPNPKRLLPVVVAIRAGIPSDIIIDHQAAHYILDNENDEKLGLLT